LQRRLVKLGALMLANDLPVPFEAEQLEGAQNSGGRSGNLPRSVEILNAQQPAARVRARVQIAGYRRVERA
jgi:hypothetical protein